MEINGVREGGEEQHQLTASGDLTVRQTPRTSGNSVPIHFVSMPFGPLFQPSIGLSLLKATLALAGFASEIHYFTLNFARRIGTDLYTRLTKGEPSPSELVGEWLFSYSLFGDCCPPPEEYIDRVLRGPSVRPVAISSIKPRAFDIDEFIREILAARELVEPFLEDCVSRILSASPRLIGFTSVFQQQVPSLTLAKRIKEKLPSAVIVFGGANCEGAMGAEVIRQFPFVDAVVSGEGERVIGELARRVVTAAVDAEIAQALDNIPGVYTKRNLPTDRDGAYPNAPVVPDMDSLPYPSYDDFFAQLRAPELHMSEMPRLLFESARGCWWGMKKHCTFCGLNGSSLTFRSKSASRAVAELSFLASKYPDLPVSVVDNILDMKYFKDFIPSLIQRDLKFELFYEVKANLTKEQLRLLKQAGIHDIQPGIESLSSNVLAIMRKGVTALQNVQLLKWCKELGLRPLWNIIWGFPGEEPSDYSEMAELIPLIQHLTPPAGASQIRLDRFSPNFDQADELGFCDVRPYPAYRHVYPLPESIVSNLAYHFTFGYARPQPVKNYTQALATQVKIWKEVHSSSDLFSIDKDGFLLICDIREVSQRPLHVLTGLAKALYVTCDAAHGLERMRHAAETHTGRQYSRAEIQEIADDLVERHLMIREGERYLSLAVPLGDYAPSTLILDRLREVMSKADSVLDDRSPLEMQDTSYRLEVEWR